MLRLQVARKFAGELIAEVRAVMSNVYVSI
jgi:hypothetical protein